MELLASSSSWPVFLHVCFMFYVLRIPCEQTVWISEQDQNVLYVMIGNDLLIEK